MILGIDLGTSAVKIVALDGHRSVATAVAPLSTDSPHPGWSEQNPAAWLDALHAAMARLLSETGLDGGSVACIGLSGQMHGTVLLDRALTVLRPCILWNDSRSHADCATLAERVPRIGEIAGVPPLPGFSAPKIMWVARNEPDIHGRIAHLLLPKDFLGHFLHGNLVTDTSDAAGTLWLDQRRRSWSHDLCDASATRPGWLPAILDGYQVAGRLRSAAARSLGLRPGIPIVAGGGDAATGAVVVGATEIGVAFISLGTSGQLFVATGDYIPNPERFVHAFAHTVPGRWYQMAAMLNGARPLSWLSGVLGCGVENVLANAARADPDRVPLFLPYLTGERSPHGDPHIRGAFHGLEDSTGTAAICRSVVEGIAFSFADAADSFGDRFDQIRQLLALGGGARSDLLLQTISNATGRRILRVKDAEGGPALGGALLAAVGTGSVGPSALAKAPEVSATFSPRTDAGLTGRLERFRSLYLALKMSG